MTTTLVATLSMETLREQLNRFLDEQPEDDDNLMDFGLTSIAVMQLVSEWKEMGVAVSFTELATELTLSGMWKLLQAKSASRG